MSRRSNDPRGLWERVSQGATTTESEFIDNVQRCLTSGEFLLLIVGDGVKEGVEELVSTIQGAPGLLYTLKLVELRCYHLELEKDWPLVVVPNVIAKTTELVRAVVRVETKSEAGISTNVQVEVDTLDIEERVPASRTVGSAASTWDETAFFDEMLKSRSEEEASAARAIYKWAEKAGLRIEWVGRGQHGKFALICDHNDIEYRTVDVSGSGWCSTNLGKLRQTPAFADEAVRRKLIENLNQIKDVSISLDKSAMTPAVKLRDLVEPASLEQFLTILGSMLNVIRKSEK